ncbi:MAG: hypothetical protein U5N85_13905 [Arcicella sp.]|nr:hypothetical protein [Arcicella sp.]
MSCSCFSSTNDFVKYWRCKQALTQHIVGTTLKGEFKLAVSADNNIKRNVYMRDPAN